MVGKDKAEKNYQAAEMQNTAHILKLLKIRDNYIIQFIRYPNNMARQIHRVNTLMVWISINQSISFIEDKHPNSCKLTKVQADKAAARDCTQINYS